MEWLVWMGAVAILGLAAVAATGRLGEFPATVTDTPQPHVPAGILSGSDLRALRFAVVPRGYSMQQVDELLDRVSRQLDQDQTAELSPSLPKVEESWAEPTDEWADPRHVDPIPEAEPQPPLTDEHLAPSARVEDPPAVPPWQATDVVLAVPEAEVSEVFVDEVFVDEAVVGEPAVGEPAVDEVFVDEPAVGEPAVGEPAVDEVFVDEAAVDVAAEEPVSGETEPAAEAIAEMPAADVALDVAEQPEPGSVVSDVAEPTLVQPTPNEPQPVAVVDEPAPSAPATKGRIKRESKAKPKPEVVSPVGEVPGDDLEEEIARLGTSQAVVADYGSALDDLVSKYSFRKVEHWYELPGFDIPAPTAPDAPEPAESAEPGQDSTSADI